MLEKVNLNGYDEFIKYVENMETTKEVNVLFSSDWCPDCVEAKPALEQILHDIESRNVLFIYVDVGDRTFWKDMKNPFRSDKHTHLSVIPTLIKWKKPQRLEGEQCGKKSLLQMFFDEDDE